MKTILLLGATGKLGQILTRELLAKNYKVIAPVRSPQKLRFKDKNLEVIKGNVVEKLELEKSLKDNDVVISVLGHGFRTKYPIQKKVLENLVPLMEKNNVKRLITITGSGLNTSEDNKGLMSSVEEKILSIIDPYRMKDAKDQQEILEKSNLDWTVVRTPIHSSRTNDKLSHVGYTKPKIWNRVGRVAISKFIIDCIEKDKWLKKSPIIY